MIAAGDVHEVDTAYYETNSVVFDYHILNLVRFLVIHRKANLPGESGKH